MYYVELFTLIKKRILQKESPWIRAQDQSHTQGFGNRGIETE